MLDLESLQSLRSPLQAGEVPSDCRLSRSSMCCLDQGISEVFLARELCTSNRRKINRGRRTKSTPQTNRSLLQAEVTKSLQSLARIWLHTTTRLSERSDPIRFDSLRDSRRTIRARPHKYPFFLSYAGLLMSSA